MTSTATVADRLRGSKSAGPLALGSWMLFDWAAQPFYSLVTTFLFAPYFSAHFIGNVTRGAALWGYTMAAAAVLIAVGSPVLGAVADARGRLKRLMAGLSVGFVLGQAALWFAVPGVSENIWFILIALIVATVCGEYNAVLNNSLMPRLVPPDQLGRLSGGGWALGYVGGLVSLLLVTGFVLVDDRTGKTMLGLKPLLPLDLATRETDRAVGPLTALWFIVFSLPFFLFTPDAPPKAGGGKVTLSSAIASLSETLRHIGRYTDIVLFFLSRMLFIDGLQAIFTFGGIYAVSVFAWPTIALGYFGIILLITAGIGAAIGGFLDDWLGSKAVIIGSLAFLIAGALGVMSIDSSHILFVIDVPPRQTDAAPFTSTGELFYVGFAMLIGLASGPLQSASRSLLARLAPAEHMSEFFGFFAFSGKVTAFAAPFVIGLLAQITGSLQSGLAGILAFLTAGLVLMIFVKIAPSR